MRRLRYAVPGLAGILAGVALSLFFFSKDLETQRLSNALLRLEQTVLVGQNRRLAQIIEEYDRHARDQGNGVRANGRLGVRGTQLVNQSGNPIQLRGMSSHGLNWFPEYINARAMLDIKARGANLFRAAMYADSVQGGYNAGGEARIINKLFTFMAVENALAVDMYVIVDWHILKDENPLRTVDSAVAFFEEISYRYKDEPGVIYEICNEPNGATTWRDIVLYAERVIPAIRKHNSDAVILVGTPNFSSDLESARQAPLDFSNIMYSYHLYTGISAHNYERDIGDALTAGLPVFVSEWGISNDPETGKPDVEEGYAFVAYMKRHGISWANWSLTNKDEECSALKPGVIKLSGWTEEDLTPSGKVVFNSFLSE